jgi:TonB family protein
MTGKKLFVFLFIMAKPNAPFYNHIFYYSFRNIFDSNSLMKTLLTLLLVALGPCTIAQTSPYSKKFFDREWKVVTDSSNASYYRVIEKKDSNDFIMKDYYISGAIEMLARCSELNPKLRLEGTIIWYYENGNIKEKCDYINGDRQGDCFGYYQNGKLRVQMKYGKKEHTYARYLSEKGVDLLPNGDGIVREDSSAQRMNFMQIRNYLNVAFYQVFFPKYDMIYILAEKLPEYIGGSEKLAKDLVKNVVYPERAKNAGITGTAFVQFVVGKDGYLKDLSVIKGFDYECDVAALQATMKLSRWSPGRQDGKAVAVKFVLPVKFDVTM